MSLLHQKEINFRAGMYHKFRVRAPIVVWLWNISLAHKDSMHGRVRRARAHWSLGRAHPARSTSGLVSHGCFNRSKVIKSLGLSTPKAITQTELNRF